MDQHDRDGLRRQRNGRWEETPKTQSRRARDPAGYETCSRSKSSAEVLQGLSQSMTSRVLARTTSADFGRDASAAASWGDRTPMAPLTDTSAPCQGRTRCKLRCDGGKLCLRRL